MTEPATGTCEKCDSQISLKADRCPECGYEPGNHGIIVTILVLLSVLWTGLMALIIVVAWIAALATSYTLIQAVGVTIGALVISTPSVVVLYLSASAERKMPTGNVKPWQELWDEA